MALRSLSLVATFVTSARAVCDPLGSYYEVNETNETEYAITLITGPTSHPAAPPTVHPTAPPTKVGETLAPTPTPAPVKVTTFSSYLVVSAFGDVSEKAFNSAVVVGATPDDATAKTVLS